MFGSFPYIPGYTHPETTVLARYLPPLPEGIAKNWLVKRAKPGDWILDPFGASPGLAVEIARAGYRVLVVAFNPINRFLLELFALPISESEFKAAIADLAASTKGNERMEAHIRSLYLTDCAHCREWITAEAFIWVRGKNIPTSKIYQCPNCLESGIYPTTEFDANLALRFRKSSLHRARALERVMPLNDPDRIHAEQAISIYLPRAVYALFSIINKIDQLPFHHHRALTALLLSVFDRTNSMWPFPAERFRPKILNIPSQYRENNVWLELENAARSWTSNGNSSKAALPLTIWPEYPPASGGVCLFDGRLSDLVSQLKKTDHPIHLSALVSAIPRPNQAYWTLSALWAGWLWGHEATSRYKTVLRRRRYDWSWHCNALSKSFAMINDMINPGVPFLGLIGEAEPGFLSATVLAAWIAELELLGISTRVETNQIQIDWQRDWKSSRQRSQKLDFDFDRIPPHIQKAISSFLAEYAEPASYLRLQAASLFAIAQMQIPPDTHHEYTPTEFITLINNAYQQTIMDRSNFARFGGSEHSSETGRYWLSESNVILKNGKYFSLSVTDRTERQIAHYLHSNPDCSYQEIDEAVCRVLPGLLTPEQDTILKCIKSYGENQPADSENWILRSQDWPEERRTDISRMEGLIRQIGDRLDFNVATSDQYILNEEFPFKLSTPPPILWLNHNGRIEYIFFVIASAFVSYFILNKNLIQSLLLEQNNNQIHKVIILPGSRSGLVDYKINRDPRFMNEIITGWQFIKFRHLRRLAENNLLTRKNLQELLALDPLANTDPQMALL